MSDLAPQGNQPSDNADTDIKRRKDIAARVDQLTSQHRHERLALIREYLVDSFIVSDEVLWDHRNHGMGSLTHTRRAQRMQLAQRVLRKSHCFTEDDLLFLRQNGEVILGLVHDYLAA